MPLMKSGSKKAFSHNVSAEMHAGKPQDQSLAIAYSVQRKNKKKKKMAEGGEAKADDKEFAVEPVTEFKSDEHKMTVEPVSDEEMKEIMKPKKKYAYGGAAEDTNEPAVPRPKSDDKRFPEDEYMSEKWSKGSPPASKPDDSRPPEDEYMADHFADGGDVDEHYSNIADAILARKRKAKEMLSEAQDANREARNSGYLKESEDKSYAEGGEVDLSENADEEPNNEDQMSYEALKKENYSETAGLDEIHSPMDSGQHGDDIDHDEHDMVESIRRKMRAKRGF